MSGTAVEHETYETLRSSALSQYPAERVTEPAFEQALRTAARLLTLLDEQELPLLGDADGERRS